MVVRLPPSIRAERLDGKTRIQYKAEAELDLANVFLNADWRQDQLVLDVATGVGTIPSMLGSDVVAHDVSNEILKQGKRIRRANWLCADACVMPFRNNIFDMVVIFAGLMFIVGRESKAKMLEECFHVLKNRGKLVIIEPTIEDTRKNLPIRFILSWKGRGIGDVGVGLPHPTEQSAESLKTILSKLGFAIIKQNIQAHHFELICERH